MIDMRLVLASLLATVVFAAGCGEKSPTSPSTSTSTSTSTTVAEASNTENFSGALAPGGSAFYSFAVAANGTVNVTLTGVSGPLVPATVQIGLGLGSPSGTGCSTTTSVTVSAGTAAQITGTYNTGVYCVRIYDVGNLLGPANYTVTIAHP